MNFEPTFHRAQATSTTHKRRKQISGGPESLNKHVLGTRASGYVWSDSLVEQWRRASLKNIFHSFRTSAGFFARGIQFGARRTRAMRGNSRIALLTGTFSIQIRVWIKNEDVRFDLRPVLLGSDEYTVGKIGWKVNRFFFNFIFNHPIIYTIISNII